MITFLRHDRVLYATEKGGERELNSRERERCVAGKGLQHGAKN
jgi:hypothetical protein